MNNIDTPMTFSQAVRMFLLAKEAAGKSPATQEFYQHVLMRFGDSIDWGWPPTCDQCERFFLNVRRDGLSAATIYTYDGGLRVFLNWCVRRKLLEDNPIDGLDRQPKPGGIPRAIPRDQLNLLFSLMQQEADTGNLLAVRDHALFRLTYDCGLRCSEVIGVKIGDLDLAEHSVTVRGKGNVQRVVYFGHSVRRALRCWLDVRHPGCAWLFVSTHVKTGMRPLTRNGVIQALRRWCDRAGIPHFRVHDLRHSYARHALRAGIDIEMVSRQLGHHDPAFTLRVYGRSEDKERRKVHLEMSLGDHLEG